MERAPRTPPSFPLQVSDHSKLSRRGFVAASAASLALLGSAESVLAQQAGRHALPATAPRRPAPLRTLTAAEARELDAITSRLLPSEPGSPGARELGVLTFADRQLGGRASDLLAPLRTGLAELRRVVAERHPGTSSFAALGAAAQDAMLTDFEKSDPSKAATDAERERLGARAALFGTALQLTIGGAFSDPKYGGNRGKQGWRLLGFTDRHSWVPPFGAADRG